MLGVSMFPRSKFELVPSKRNLEHNLGEHLSSEKHRENVEFQLCSTSHGPVRSGAKGQPKNFDPRDLKRQRCIDSFFVGVQSSGSVSNPSSTEDCKKEPGEVHSDLSLLCWGFWFTSTIVYGGNVYDVKPLLDDQKRGCTWYAEPYLKPEVYNPTTRWLEKIEGTFRHDNCSRVSAFGGGFENLCCSACYNIPKTSSFRFRCTREDDAAIKRGSRNSLLCIRLDYLTIPELRAQAECRARARRKEQIELFRLKRRVCTLLSQTCKVAQIASEFAKRKDIVSFLRNICNAHKNGAFGGREALWEFLCDVGHNMNRAAKDYWYSKSTQAIQQALFQFGGRQVVNCMSMNLLTPSLRTVKRNKSTFVPFLCGLQDSNFEEMAKILTAAKALHGIIGDVVVILAKDETRVKPTVRWEARRDTLIGFCGDKDNHVCKMGLEVEVGSGESGYSKIVESFEQKIQDWDKCCRQVVGPVLGHASDGDARRRKLMLEDYLGSEGQRWTVGWDGWVLSGIVLDSGDIVFRDKFPRMALPLHLLGSDSCEQFFSRVGGMRGYERNYDFEDLLDCASGLNHLAVLEYGEDVVKLSKAHVKHRPLWAKLHPLPPGYAKLDLSDFARLATDD
ncbi:hypothetical protein R1flu_015576 [Riccia fluitans]|uniref:Uncharacterized protein n=1 Tax=Riccia fluitans TaxID=41844 RepID=A0ABD1YJN8_9MARC